MKIPGYDPRRHVGTNMTPMIDVVFLLIIFFLVSSHLARRENELQLDLPAAASGEDATDEGRPRVTLNILPDGRLELAGAAVVPNQLAKRLQNARQREGENLELRIRADRDVPYQSVSPVLASAAESGIWNVTFSVIQPHGARP